MYEYREYCDRYKKLSAKGSLVHIFIFASAPVFFRRRIYIELLQTLPDGKLLDEMILVCDAYRKDLQHPNEFIRGSTLRYTFLKCVVSDWCYFLSKVDRHYKCLQYIHIL